MLGIRLPIRGALLALALVSIGVGAATPQERPIDGWLTEPGIDPPSYAVTEPIDGNVNVSIVTLVCGDIDPGRGVEFDLTLSEPGPLRPNGTKEDQLKDAPSVEIAIDDRVFPARLLFADEYVIVTDAAVKAPPLLSDRLLDAMQRGATMVLRFDLMKEKAGETETRDGTIVIDLVRGHGAIAAVRRCASGEMFQAVR